MGRIFDRYICDLQNAGQGDAAAALGNLYNLFVSLGWVFVPDDVSLPALSDAGEVGEELHVVKL